LVFGETLPTEEPAAVLRPLAFTLAILGAALLAGFGGRTGPAGAVAQSEELRSP
jgi:hypothetical protein